MSADRFKWLEFSDDDPGARKQIGDMPLPGRELDTGKDEHWHMAEAELRFQDGEFEPALRNYSAAIKYRPDLEAAWAGQTRCMSLLGQTPQSVTWARKGLDHLHTSG